MRQRTFWLISAVLGLTTVGGCPGGDDSSQATLTATDTDLPTATMTATDVTASGSTGTATDTEGTTTEDCDEGTVSCACLPTGTCNGSLICISGVCVDTSESTTGTGTGSDTDTDTDTDTSSTTSVTPECSNGSADPGEFCLFNPIPLAMGVGPADVLLFDADGNDTLDVATSNIGDLSVTIRVGSGTGMFGVVSATPIPAGGQALVDGDFNGDTFADIATTGAAASLNFLAGNGNGTFAASVAAVTSATTVTLASAEISGDAFDDVVTGNNAVALTGSVLLGQAVPFLESATVVTTLLPVSTDLADFLGNGTLDLLIASTTPELRLFLGSGAGGFGAPGIVALVTAPLDVAVGDFNGDTNLDAAVLGAGGMIDVYPGDGIGGFGLPINTLASGTAVALTAGDLNLDGNLDLAVLDGTQSTVFALLGTGTGMFMAQPGILVGMGPVAIVAGDINGDGHLDLATANSLANSVTLILSDA